MIEYTESFDHKSNFSDSKEDRNTGRVKEESNSEHGKSPYLPGVCDKTRKQLYMGTSEREFHLFSI